MKEALYNWIGLYKRIKLERFKDFEELLHFCQLIDQNLARGSTNLTQLVDTIQTSIKLTYPNINISDSIDLCSIQNGSTSQILNFFKYLVIYAICCDNKSLHVNKIMGLEQEHQNTLMDIVKKVLEGEGEDSKVLDIYQDNEQTPSNDLLKQFLCLQSKFQSLTQKHQKQYSLRVNLEQKLRQMNQDLQVVTVQLNQYKMQRLQLCLYMGNSYQVSDLLSNFRTMEKQKQILLQQLDHLKKGQVRSKQIIKQNQSQIETLLLEVEKNSKLIQKLTSKNQKLDFQIESLRKSLSIKNSHIVDIEQRLDQCQRINILNSNRITNRQVIQNQKKSLLLQIQNKDRIIQFQYKKLRQLNNLLKQYSNQNI